nr:hypothetical protein [Bradyrhizobium elkanii]
MQAAAINLDAQQFLEPNVGDPHLAAEMVDQRELTRLVRGFEGDALQAELGGETIRKRTIENAVIIEEPNAPCRFSALDDDLLGPGIEPALALDDELGDNILAECAAVLLAELELYIEPALMCHGDDRARRERHVGEALAGLDPRHADVGAKVQIGVQLALGDGDFEWATARDRSDIMGASQRDFLACSVFIRNQPASHGDLQDRDQMRALLQVALQRDRIVARVEHTRGRRHGWNANER